MLGSEIKSKFFFTTKIFKNNDKMKNNKMNIFIYLLNKNTFNLGK